MLESAVEDILVTNTTIEVAARNVDTLNVLVNKKLVEERSLHLSLEMFGFKLNVGIQETKLSSIEEIIEEMLTVQQKWLYLESILVESGDIAEKLPKELDRFTEVNKAFKKIMKKALLEKRSILFVLTQIF